MFSKILSGLLCIAFWCAVCPVLFAQSFPKGIFISPVSPGKPNFLNGNFGELRPDHFHAGIDFRTEMRIGMPIHAPASGYVCRMLVMDKGYGNALFLRHDKGYITVHGHLEDYNPVLTAYLRKKQAENQSFTQDLTFDKNTTPYRFKQGDTVAFGGNTGTSFGPHLHFEVRDTLNNLLNPLYFGFPELKDDIPPVFQRIALRSLNLESRVQSEFGITEFYPQKMPNGEYQLHNPVPVFGLLGLEVLANDLSEGSFGRNGIQCMEVRLDGKEVYSHHLASYAYEKSRFSNVHADYEMAQKGLRYEKCYVDDGNTLGMYQTDALNGKLQVVDNRLHEVIISLFDSYLNASHLRFTLQGSPPAGAVLFQTTAFQVAAPLVQTSVSGNTLVLKTRNTGKDHALRVFLQKQEATLTPAYVRNQVFTYLWDLRKGLPDSLLSGSKVFKTRFRHTVLPGTETAFIQDSLRIRFFPKSLFDTLYLETEKKQNTVSIGNTNIPLQTDFIIEIIPKGIKNKQQTSLYLASGRNLIFLKSKWKGDTLQAVSRYFGNFVVASDTLPPLAKLRSKPTARTLNCTMLDERSGVASYRATLNGEWLLMNFDYKTARLWAETGRTTDKLLKGKFRLEVTDNAGNQTVLELML